MKWNLLFKLLSVRSNFSKCGFLFLGSIIAINHSLFSYNLFIGDITFSDPIHLSQTENLPLEGVIDGLIPLSMTSGVHGFNNLFHSHKPSYLQLEIALPLITINQVDQEFAPSPFDLNLKPTESVDYYSFTTRIYYNWTNTCSAKGFTLSYSTDDGTTFTKITDYIHAKAENSPTTLSYNTNGDITATKPKDNPRSGTPLIVHVVQYKIPESILGTMTHLRYNLKAGAGWGTLNPHVRISEFDSTLNAEIIPEPSTYAWLLGFISFVFIAFKKRKAA